MAIAPSKLGSLIANHSQTHHALVQRLRELELVIDEASDADLLATLTRVRDEHAALPPSSQMFNSPWERVRVFLKPYLTEKGRTWAEPLKSLHVPDEEDVPYGRRKTRLVLAQVPADEAAPFYAEFLAAFPDGRVGEHLDAQVGQLDALCGLLQWRAAFRYEEGKWTVNEVIGHLLDTERVWAYRLLRIARGDETVPNPTATALIRSGDLKDVATFFRNDLAFALGVGFGKNPHTFLTNIGGTPPVAAVAVGAQSQIAVFFASGGALIIDPDGPGPLFEVPIAGPLPEDLGFIP